MRLAKTALLILLPACLPAFAAEPHSAFSGTWELEAPHVDSAAAQPVPIPQSKVAIALTDTALVLEMTRTEIGSSTRFHEVLHLKLDGTETVAPGDAGVPVTGKARWDAGRLIVDTARNINEATVTTHYTYTLSPDGKHMTIDKALTVQHGYEGQAAKTTGSGTEVYVRAQN